MVQHRDKTQIAVALWTCDHCQVWWISQAAEAPQTWRLFRLDKVDSPKWVSMPPAWKVTGPDPSICPECGTMMSEQDVSNHLVPTSYLAMLN